MGATVKRSNKARNNKRRKKRAKKYAPTKAADMAMAAIEQETKDLLDPIKNAKDSDLFVKDTAKEGRFKKIPNKITWAERATTSRGLGYKLPKYTGLSFKEKRLLAGKKDMSIVDAKVARMLAKKQKEEEGVKEEGETETIEIEDDEEGDEVMEGDEPEEEENQERKSKKIKTEKSEDEKKPMTVKVEKTTVVQKGDKVVSQKTVAAYDLWGPAPERQVKPQESFIQEILYPAPPPVQKTHKPKSKIPAVPVATPGQSYRPDAETHSDLKRKRDAEAKKVSVGAQESAELIQNLAQPGGYYLPIAKYDNDDDEEENGEEVEVFRPEMKKHRTLKEKRIAMAKKSRKDQEERSVKFERMQRDIHRVDDILLTIEEEEKAKQAKKDRKTSHAGQKYFEPRGTDNRLVKQPEISAVANAPSQNLRTLNAIVNPIKDRLLNMKSRGLLTQKKSGAPGIRMYKTVESHAVREQAREDREKYLKPVLDEEERKKQQAKSNKKRAQFQ